MKPETDFFSFFSAKCQTVLKIEGVTRGPEVDLETPLRCFFEEIARRLHERPVFERQGLANHRNPQI